MGHTCSVWSSKLQSKTECIQSTGPDQVGSGRLLHSRSFVCPGKPSGAYGMCEGTSCETELSLWLQQSISKVKWSQGSLSESDQQDPNFIRLLAQLRWLLPLLWPCHVLSVDLILCLRMNKQLIQNCECHQATVTNFLVFRKLSNCSLLLPFLI